MHLPPGPDSRSSSEYKYRSVDGSIAHRDILSHVRQRSSISLLPEYAVLMFRRGSREGSRARTNTRVLVLSTILLYASTGTYIAALVWNRSQANRLVVGATDGLYSASYDGRRDTAAFEDALWGQSWMAVIALESSVRRGLTIASRILALISSRRYCTVHYGGRDRMVARVRHLAQQGGVLHRAASRVSYSGYVPSNLPEQPCPRHARLITSQSLASSDTTSRRSSRRPESPFSSQTTRSSRPPSTCPWPRTLSRPP